MTPVSLFNIILKVLGIIFLKEILVFFPQLLGMFSSGHLSDLFPSLVAILLMIVVYLTICYLLLFKTEKIIILLKLNRGFDQEFIPLNFHRSAILSIVIMVIGGLMVANEIPNLCTQLFQYISLKKEGYRDAKISYSVLAGSKVMIGLTMIIYQRYFVNLIEYKRMKQINPPTPYSQ